MKGLKTENWSHFKMPSLTSLAVESGCQFKASVFFFFFGGGVDMHFSMCSLLKAGLGFSTVFQW